MPSSTVSNITVVSHLFRLGLEIAAEEQSRGYNGIQSIPGITSCVFNEHCEELSEPERFELLLALVKRRARREGLVTSETTLSSKETAAINFYLEHNSSLHGKRFAAQPALCRMEEDLASGLINIDLASKRSIRAAILEELKALRSIELKHTQGEIRWFAPIKSDLRLFGMVDLSKKDEQATSFLVLCRGEQALHAHTSFLAVLGLGTTSWQYLPKGEERLCASQTVAFFLRVQDVLTKADVPS